MNDETRRILSDDTSLEKALAAQKRRSRPHTLQEARTMVEELMVPTLAAEGLTLPEARVEATRVLAWLERAAHEHGFEQGVKQASE